MMRGPRGMGVGRGAALALVRLVWVLALRGALAANNDKEGLVALYEATNGASWYSRQSACKQGWDLSTEPCNGTTANWGGIVNINGDAGCSSERGLHFILRIRVLEVVVQPFPQDCFGSLG